MQYIGRENFEHGEPARIGVLVTNLGTPEAPEKSALKTYLREFLADPRVVEIPRALWLLILHGIILNVRPARSAEAYRAIWTSAGSPLRVHTEAQAQALGALLGERCGERISVAYAMRYGEPSIHAAIENLLQQGVRQLLVLPLYPQYSCATTASTFDALAADFTRRRWLPELHFITSYHDHPAYIAALADSVRAFQAKHGRAGRLIFSYHGEPRRYLDRGDPYHCQCHKTTRLVAQALGLGEQDYCTTFQSRFGRAEWLQPYTDETLKKLPGEGVKTVQVICPGFSSDCLETLEEIAVENRDYFLGAGGTDFHYIPCLNSEPAHIEALATIVQQQLGVWLQSPSNDNDSKARALAMGAEQ
tara:strand:- start:29067 stop:30149 length:1083 start_codon:yes stop_codon:yes gene_type:complete